jgi:hypothetical protein
MSTRVKETTRVLDIKLPEQLAQQVETVAREQKTDVNELVQWAIRVYLHRLAGLKEELDSPINPDDPNSMSMTQVYDMIHEIRREEERKTA